MMLKYVGPTLVMLFAGTTLAASPATPPQETKCEIGGWSIDSDPQGLNVRSAPDAKAPIVATLPPVRYKKMSDDYPALGIGPSFNIIGSSNGWLKIQGGNDDDSMIIDQKARKTYAGIGWVWGGKVGLNLQTTRGFEKPDPKSTVLFNATGQDVMAENSVTGIAACDGKWVLADARPYEEPTAKQRASIRAWFRGACAHRETTCDGTVGD